ncbi:hypothetical protein [Acuticoccus sediminis]|uniref:hypothetical protein n=1 Tax=Acuticoccus sediminis TaxID=2184697 RepID=UPI001CFDA824|nr:hypothetical protein [Acuticoccus sediminis]
MANDPDIAGEALFERGITEIGNAFVSEKAVEVRAAASLSHDQARTMTRQGAWSRRSRHGQSPTRRIACEYLAAGLSRDKLTLSDWRSGTVPDVFSCRAFRDEREAEVTMALVNTPGARQRRPLLAGHHAFQTVRFLAGLIGKAGGDGSCP